MFQPGEAAIHSEKQVKWIDLTPKDIQGLRDSKTFSQFESTSGPFGSGLASNARHSKHRHLFFVEIHHFYALVRLPLPE